MGDGKEMDENSREMIFKITLGVLILFLLNQRGGGGVLPYPFGNDVQYFVDDQADQAEYSQERYLPSDEEIYLARYGESIEQARIEMTRSAGFDLENSPAEDVDLTQIPTVPTPFSP